MDKIKEFIKNNFLIIILLFLSVSLHIITTIHLGVDYNINSDDISYFNSGVTFKNEGTITMHNEFKSAQIMPGMTYLIGFISLIAGEGQTLWLVLKIIWGIFGILSIIGIYKLTLFLLDEAKHKKICAFIAGVPLLLPSFLWMDNLILTETPFMCAFIYLLYFTLKEGKVHSKKNFIFITLLYLWCTLLKANFAIYPIILIAYLLYKKYDRKLLIKEVLLAMVICLIFFVPWTIRNYKVFGEFIPLTYGGGNPLLLGTYQGYGYPDDEKIGTDEYIKKHSPEDIKQYLDGNASEDMHKYYSLKLDKLKAEYRMQKWWEDDKLSMIISYGVLKPKELLGVFYWDEIFGIKNMTMQIIRIIELLIFTVLFFVLFFRKKIDSDIVFLLSNVIIQGLIYSYTFTFTRYGQTLIFVIYIIIALGINEILTSKETKKLQNVNKRKMKYTNLR